MNGQLADWVLEACATRGIRAQRDGAAVRVRDGLVIEPQAFPRTDVKGPAQTRVEFAIDSPRLQGLPLPDSHAGFGKTPEDAARDACDKFLQGSFDVVVTALTDHAAAGAALEREDWRGPAGAWRVTSGPLLTLATRPGAHIGGFAEFFPPLHDLLRERLPAGPHWVRVFLGGIDHAFGGGEILVDGGNWAEGEELLRAHGWVFPDGYASLRHLLIALPLAA